MDLVAQHKICLFTLLKNLISTNCIQCLFDVTHNLGILPSVLVVQLMSHMLFIILSDVSDKKKCDISPKEPFLKAFITRTLYF